jgi:hypothetical protein
MTNHSAQRLVSVTRDRSHSVLLQLPHTQEKTLRVRPVEGHKANLFLPRLYENLAGVGEIGECDVVLRLFGEIADGLAAAERQRARRVRGSAQGA